MTLTFGIFDLEVTVALLGFSDCLADLTIFIAGFLSLVLGTNVTVLFRGAKVTVLFREN